jgi:hypothetical protein
MKHRLHLLLPLFGLLLLHCAPVMPQRTKMGGAARWAYDLSQQPAILWAKDATLCRVVGVGVGGDGWLPDRGGNWILTYWSHEFDEVLEVSVDSDGKTSIQKIVDSPYRGSTIPREWKDSSTVWAATRSHQVGVPLSTFSSELSILAAAETHPQQIVWRLRFFLTKGGFETHIVSSQGQWIAKE